MPCSYPSRNGLYQESDETSENKRDFPRKKKDGSSDCKNETHKMIVEGPWRNITDETIV